MLTLLPFRDRQPTWSRRRRIIAPIILEHSRLSYETGSRCRPWLPVTSGRCRHCCLRVREGRGWEGALTLPHRPPRTARSGPDSQGTTRTAPSGFPDIRSRGRRDPWGCCGPCAGWHYRLRFLSSPRSCTAASMIAAAASETLHRQGRLVAVLGGRLPRRISSGRMRAMLYSK